MPLQIRRGLNAERTQIAPSNGLVEGELLYTTDEKKLYIGTGAVGEHQGVVITGYTNNDAKDAAAQILTTGDHSGIGFTYDNGTKKINATVDLSGYTGSIAADSLKGSVFADDSSIFLDAIDRVLYGNVTGNVLGNLSGNVVGNVIGDVLGNLQGNVVGNVFGSVVGNLQGDVTGNVFGNLTGDVKGSIFADDSGLIVDAIDRVFYGTLNTGDIQITNNTLIGNQILLGNDLEPAAVTLRTNTNLRVRSPVDGVEGNFVTIDISRGTLESPAAVQAGDELAGLAVKAYTDSSTSAVAGILGFTVDPTAVITGGNFVKSLVIISAASDTSQEIGDAFLLDSAGVATSNAFVANKFMQLPVYADDTARGAAIPTPAAGMMVFMTSGTVPTVTNKPVIYNGTAWEAF